MVLSKVIIKLAIETMSSSTLRPAHTRWSRSKASLYGLWQCHFKPCFQFFAMNILQALPVMG